MLATINQVINALRDTEIDAEDLESKDAKLIQRLIGYASYSAQSITNQLLIRQVYVRTFNGNGGTKLLLPTMSNPEITKVVINDAEVELTTIKVSQSGVVYSENGFPEGFQNIEITFECGYEATDAGTGEHEPPADMNEAVIAEVVSRYRMYQEINIPTAEGAQAGVEDTRTFLNKEAKEMLEPYRRIV